MKNIKLLVILFCFTVYSCGDDKPSSALDCSASYSQEFQTELTNISNASVDYGQDPTSANCQAFKDAYLAYIDALEGWEECAAINNSIADYDAALDEARQSVNAIIC